MMVYNPSHLLIARNGPPRSPAQPITSNSATPFSQANPNPNASSTPANPSPLNSQAEGGGVLGFEINRTFRRDAELPGTVKVIVEGCVFWVHWEVLYFSSPFFQAALSGEWAETGARAPSFSSSTTSATRQPPYRPHQSSSTPSHSQTFEDEDSDQPSNDRSGSDPLAALGAGGRDDQGDVEWEDVDDRAATPSGPQASSLSPQTPASTSPDHSQTPPTPTSRGHESIYLDASDSLEPHEEEALRSLREMTEDEGESSGTESGRTSEEISRQSSESTRTSDSDSAQHDPRPRSQGSAAAAYQPLLSPSSSALPILSIPHIPATSTPSKRAHRLSASSTITVHSPRPRRASRAGAGGRRQRGNRQRHGQQGNGQGEVEAEADIKMEDVRAVDFQDFLCWVYPHLECVTTWNNVEGLISLADRLTVSPLRDACVRFLLSHAAGKPMKAMQLAELYELPELYREGSRYVLDNLSAWEPAEWEELSKSTVIKLHQRKEWYFERLMKLNLTDIKRDYQCCNTCPDPQICAKILDDRWRQAYANAFRFGSPQPSIIFRYLRLLETTPPLVLPQTACQNAAKNWASSLFERMFATSLAAGFGSSKPKHFLYINL